MPGGRRGGGWGAPAAVGVAWDGVCSKAAEAALGGLQLMGSGSSSRRGTVAADSYGREAACCSASAPRFQQSTSRGSKAALAPRSPSPSRRADEMFRSEGSAAATDRKPGLPTSAEAHRRPLPSCAVTSSMGSLLSTSACTGPTAGLIMRRPAAIHRGSVSEVAGGHLSGRTSCQPTGD